MPKRPPPKKDPPLEPGIHLVHKPVGVTSFSVVQTWLERAARQPGKLPLCHGGTLDPFAEGLLLILVGQATRLMDLVHAAPKHYVADVTWGRETDTGNPAGTTVFEGDPTSLDPSRLDAALATFLGWHDQVPPATSAKKIGGEPAYRKVLRGERVELPPSRVYLHEARWLSHSLPRTSRLYLACRGGFYVRSLARDLGRMLGCGAHLHALRRTGIGPWRDPGPGRTVRISGEDLLPWLDARRLDDDELAAVQQGKDIARGRIDDPGWPVPSGFPDPAGPVRAIHAGRLVALLETRGDVLHPIANLRGGL